MPKGKGSQAKRQFRQEAPRAGGELQAGRAWCGRRRPLGQGWKAWSRELALPGACLPFVPALSLMRFVPTDPC